jgi:hypothetical protein
LITHTHTHTHTKHTGVEYMHLRTQIISRVFYKNSKILLHLSVLDAKMPNNYSNFLFTRIYMKVLM